MSKAIIALILSLAFLPNTYGADNTQSISLKECLKVGIEKNASVLKAGYDKTTSELKISSELSGGLPHIDGFVQSLDNVKKSVMVLPGSMLGKPGTTLALEVGSQYSTSAGVKFNQLLYSQTYFLSLSVSKKLYEVSALNLEKVKSDVIYDVTKMYALASITNMQIKLIENNINRLDSIIYITKAQVENGYAKSVDLDRANAGKSNLLIQFDNTSALYKQQLDMIKYYIDLPKDANIAINDSISSLLANSAFEFNEAGILNRKEVKLLDLQTELYKDNLSAAKYEYLPTLSFIGQAQYQNMREDYKLFGTQWFANAYIGLNLNIPIFDGFGRRSKVNMAEVDLLKSELEFADVKKYFATNLDKANRDYKTNTDALKRQNQNVVLAENILAVSKIKFGEGNMAMSDLLNDESNLAGAEQNYLNTKLQLVFSELELLKSIGKLEILLNN